MNINFSPISGSQEFSQNNNRSPELQNLSELHQTMPHEEPIKPNIIAVQLLDSFIGNTLYEGASSEEVTEYFIKIMRSLQKEPYGKVLADIIPLFDQCLE
jgi:hypothetical protein